jgi:hypothetical protein
MTANPIQHVWSSEALFTKALLYVGEMERYTADDWQFGLWSSLSLELIARAALSHISPTLLASRKDWRNIHHALGHAPTKTDFAPTSLATNEVLSILREVLPEFTKELADFCGKHTGRRNAELHSGEDVFAGLGTSSWLPQYFASCGALLRSMGRGLDDLFDNPQVAEDMIASLQDTAAKAVQQDIKAHEGIWQKKTPEEQKESLAQATTWATRHAGHRTKCPACHSPSLIRGSSHGAVTTEIGQDRIVQRQTMLPSSFECVACNLRISGLSKLSVCGLGDAFTATSTSSAADFFGLHTEDELEEARASGLEPEFEEDFNEY